MYFARSQIRADFAVRLLSIRRARRDCATCAGESKIKKIKTTASHSSVYKASFGFRAGSRVCGRFVCFSKAAHIPLSLIATGSFIGRKGLARLKQNISSSFFSSAVIVFTHRVSFSPGSSRVSLWPNACRARRQSLARGSGAAEARITVPIRHVCQLSSAVAARDGCDSEAGRVSARCRRRRLDLACGFLRSLGRVLASKRIVPDKEG